MDKRSALLTAGGLAASFVAGAAAVSFNWGIGIPQATTAADGGLTIPLKPVVKHRTVVIHKKAPSPPDRVRGGPDARRAGADAGRRHQQRKPQREWVRERVRGR